MPDAACPESTRGRVGRVLVLGRDPRLADGLATTLRDCHVIRAASPGGLPALAAGLPRLDVVLVGPDAAPAASGALPETAARDVIAWLRGAGVAAPVVLVTMGDAPAAGLGLEEVAGCAGVVHCRGRALDAAALAQVAAEVGRYLEGGAAPSARHPPLADLVDEPVIEMDARCRVLRANAAATASRGLPPGALAGRACTDVLPRAAAGAGEPHDCIVQQALRSRRQVELAFGQGERAAVLRARPVPGSRRVVVLREVRATGAASRERQLAEHVAALGAEHACLRDQAARLERVLAASASLKDAGTREDLAARILQVLGDLPGFGLVAVGLLDADNGTTEIAGIARLPGGQRVALGRRTVLLDLLRLSVDRRQVSASYVIEGWSISVQGEPTFKGTRRGLRQWDLAEIFDGTPVALTPLSAAGRTHGFLVAKAEDPTQPIDLAALRAVELLADVAAVSFDHLRLLELERRRSRLAATVARLERKLLSVQDPARVLDLAARTLASVFETCAVEHEAVRAPLEGGTVALRRPRVLKVAAGEPAAAAVPVAAQLVVPVRCAGRLRAVFQVTSPVQRAFDEVDLTTLDVFAEVVGKAHASADAFEQELASAARLRLVADIARIGGSTIEVDDFLPRALARICQHAAYEAAAVALVDRDRRRLVLRAHAARSGRPRVQGTCTDLGAGLAGVVAESGRPLLIGDGPRAAPSAGTDPAVRSRTCVPLRFLDEVVGVLDVESTQRAAFDDHDLAALTSIAEHLAGALHVARLFQEVREANRRLRESERNKTDFLAVVAHDLRTPLTSIRSAAEMALMYRDEPPEVRNEFIGLVREEALRLGRLVDDFLAYARMEEGVLDYHVVALDLEALLAHFAHVFAGPAEQRRIELRHDAATLPPVLADRERVSQVLANLLANATRYTPEGGRIQLCARPLPPTRPGQVLGRIQVDVSDNGPGLEDCHRERVFDRFFRIESSDRARGGTGLGLPIARSIVEHLGGRMWVDSSPGRGATFSFTLPAVLAPPCPGGAGSAPAA